MQEVTFGSWLKQRRTELGVTRDELSERVGFSLDLLRKLESGERRPSGQIAHLLADYFRVPADEREAFVIFARSGQAASGEVSSATSSSSTSSSAPWRAVHLRQANLPSLLTPLIGREKEEKAACELLLSPKVRLLTLTGPPGIGKTRLGLQVASDLVEHFADGVYFVDLSPVSSPDLVLPTVARVLALKETADRSIEEMLLEYAHTRRMLLVLDNFEQVLDAGPEVVRLMEASPWLKVLVTSREALRVRGERRFPVPPLGVPDLRQMPVVEALGAYPAVELFVERAQAVEPTFALSEENASELAAVCVGLEGLPLAIELAASRIAHLSPAEMQAGLTSRLKMLAVGARDLPTRHRTLHAAIEWSYNLLGEEERRFFGALGVFVGGFTLEAAQAVAAARRDAEAALLLQSLVDKNLLRSEHWAGHPGFRMLEMVREYAGERLEDAGETEAAKKRHLEYYLALAEQASPELRGHRQFEWLGRLEKELDNIRAALDWAARRGETERGLRILDALWWFWELGGYTEEGLRWSLLVLSAAQEEEHSPVKARVLAGAGVFAYNTPHSDYELAASLLKEGLALSRSSNDNGGIAGALRGQGLLARVMGEHATARTLIEGSLQISRRLGDRVAIADGTYALGVVLQHDADYAQARLLLEESLALYEEIGDRALSVYVLTWLGDLARCEEDYTGARRLVEEHIELSLALWDNPDLRCSLHNLGHVAHHEGNYREAIELFTESLELSRDLDDNLIVGACLAGLAGVAASLLQPERAARLFGAAYKLGAHFDQADLLDYNRNMAATRAQLSAEAFTAAWEQGRAMPLEESAAYALQNIE